MVLSTEWSQVEVIDLVNDGNGLGFILVGGRSTGVVIKALTPGGVAERDGRLQCGDHLLQIGDVTLRGYSSEQVATVLRQTGAQVRLIVARPVEPTGNDYQNLASHAPIIPTKLLSDPEELSRHLYQNSSFAISGAICDNVDNVDVDAHENGNATDARCFVSTPDTELADLPLPPLPAQLCNDSSKRPCPRDLDIVPFSLISPPPKSVSTTSRSLVSALKPPPSQLNMPTLDTRLPRSMDHIETVIVGHSTDPTANHNSLEFDQCSDTSSNYMDSPETETYVVELHKNVYGLGITVAGYVCEEEDLSGIFVKSIIEGSAAEMSGQIQINDRIVAVDSKSLAGVTNHQAVEILRNTDIEVHLTLERFLRGRKYEHLQVALTELKVDTQSQSSLPASPSIATLTWLPPKSDADSIATEGGGGVGIVGGSDAMTNFCDLPSRDTVESNMSIMLDRSENEEICPSSKGQGEKTPTTGVGKSLTNGNISNLISNGFHEATNELIKQTKPPNGQPVSMTNSHDNDNDDDDVGIVVDDKGNEALRKPSLVALTTTIATTTTTTTTTSITTTTTMMPIKKSVVTSPSSESLKVAWKSEFPESEIYVAEINKLSGLGISLEGTVDVECGIEKRPHHFIRSILEDGPVGRQGILKPGDELLQVNDHKLQGLKHTEVVKILKELPTRVKLVCARGTKPPTIINTSQNPEAFDARSILPGGHQSLQNLLTKALSESSLYTSSTATLTDQQRSKSLENVSGLALWSCDVTTIEIDKTEQGFGFSILDYQDPLDSESSVIVIRGLIRGGAAEATNDIFPGDRLVSVGDNNLQGLELDEAVAILKGMPVGKTKLGICRPLSSSDSNIASPADAEDSPST